MKDPRVFDQNDTRVWNEERIVRQAPHSTEQERSRVHTGETSPQLCAYKCGRTVYSTDPIVICNVCRLKHDLPIFTGKYKNYMEWFKRNRIPLLFCCFKEDKCTE